MGTAVKNMKDHAAQSEKEVVVEEEEEEEDLRLQIRWE